MRFLVVFILALGSGQLFSQENTAEVLLNNAKEGFLLFRLPTGGSTLLDSKNQNSLNVSNLSSGIYILRVTSEFGDVLNKRLVKQ